ncbi:MAG: hypothetical protein R2932_48845 [Caldilineaceae bacterium]
MKSVNVNDFASGKMIVFSHVRLMSNFQAIALHWVIYTPAHVVLLHHYPNIAPLAVVIKRPSTHDNSAAKSRGMRRTGNNFTGD